MPSAPRRLPRSAAVSWFLHLESVSGGTRRRNENLIIFKAKMEVIKDIVAHHQAEPAAVVSVGKEVQRNQ